MKLIKKLSDTHYIVVDGDSEIKEGYFVLFNNQILQTDYFDSWFNKWEFKNYPISAVEYQKYDKPKKITHSTQPLEQRTNSYSNGFNMKSMSSDVELVFDKIEPLYLSEVKELFSEDTDVWSRKLEYLKKVDENTKHKSQDERIWIFGASDLGFTAGYKQALEDNKERKYTEKDIRNVIMQIRTQLVKHNYNHYSINYDSIIQSL